MTENEKIARQKGWTVKLVFHNVLWIDPETKQAYTSLPDFTSDKG